MGRTAPSALRGSCHQCGSYVEDSGPDRSPGSLTGTRSPRTIDLGLPPLCETTVRHPARRAGRRSRRRPWRRRWRGRPWDEARTREDRCSVAGSGGPRSRQARRSRGASRRSASSSRLPTGEPLLPFEPQPRQDQQRHGSTDSEERAAPHPGAAARAAATSAKMPPPSTAIAAPGGAFVFTESQRPTTPSAAASTIEPSCQGRNLRVSNRTVAAGTTNSAVARARRWPQEPRRR